MDSFSHRLWIELNTIYVKNHSVEAYESYPYGKETVSSEYCKNVIRRAPLSFSMHPLEVSFHTERKSNSRMSWAMGLLYWTRKMSTADRKPIKYWPWPALRKINWAEGISSISYILWRSSLCRKNRDKKLKCKICYFKKMFAIWHIHWLAYYLVKAIWDSKMFSLWACTHSSLWQSVK